MSKPVIEPTATLQSARSHGGDATHTHTPDLGPVITRFDIEPGDRNLLVSWAANVRTQKVKIFYRPSGGDYQSTVFLGDNTAPGASGSHRISYLAGNSDYDVYVRPYMANNTAGTDSATLTRRTLMADLTVRGLRVNGFPESLGVEWFSSSDQATYQILWERADRSSVDKSDNSDAGDLTVSEFGSEGGIEGSNHLIDGLIGGERYRIEVTAFNAEGVAGEPSEVFGTPESAAGALPGRPGTPQAEQTADDEVELTWNKPGDGSQTITKYEVRYCGGDCSLPVLYRQFDAPVDADDNPLTTITKTIDNLVGGETYRFAVRARSIVGLGSWSSERTITLEREGMFDTQEPPAAPDALSVYVLDGDTSNPIVGVTWAYPYLDRDENNPILGYELQYTTHLNPVPRSFVFFPPLDADGVQQELPTVTIKYLPTRTTYTIRLRADNLSGYGPWSRSRTIYLPDSELNLTPLPTATPLAATAVPAPPSAPTNLDGWAFTDAQDDSFISVFWDHSSFDGGPRVTDFPVRYRWVGQDWIYRGIYSYRSFFELHDTTAINGRRYEIQVAARNDFGTSNYTSSLYLTPLKAPDSPDEPTHVAGDGELRVSWTQPNSNDRSISYYQLLYREAAGGPATTIERINGTSYTIRNLTNGTRYKVAVRAVSSAGTSNWSVFENGTPGA